MKKLGIIAILTIAVLSLIGCGISTGKSSQEKKSIKIGVTLYDKNDTFVSQLMESFMAYAKEKETETGVVINVEVYHAASDQSTQNDQVETMINNGCDVLCVNLVDRTAPTNIIDKAKAADVPIVFFNRELVEGDLQRWNKIYYVGASANESGTLQGKIAAEEIMNKDTSDKNGDGIIQYVILEGEAGHQDAIVRTEFSVKALLAQNIEVEKLAHAIANWNRAQAQMKYTQMLKEFSTDIELVIANNDDMALGAIDALKAADIPRDEWPIIVGVDGTDVGLKAIADGEMAGTVYNDRDGQAKAMMNLAYGLASQTDISYLKLEAGKYIRLPYQRVEKEDVENYPIP